MKPLSEGEKLYWQDEKEAKERIRKEYGIIGIIKGKIEIAISICGADWEEVEKYLRTKKIKKMYKL